MYISNIFKFISMICFLVIIGNCTKQQENKVDLPIAKNGIIDLSNWDVYKDGYIELKGDWQFYWNELLSADQLKKTNLKPLLFNLPSTWNDFKINGKELGSTGYATYTLKIINHNDKNNLMALELPLAYTSYKIWINDQLFYENGKVGKSAE